MNPLLQPISDLITQATALQTQIQGQITGNVADIVQLQTEFKALATEVAKTDQALGTLATAFAGTIPPAA